MQPELFRAMPRIPFTLILNWWIVKMNISRILLKSEGSTVLILHDTLWLYLGFTGWPRRGMTKTRHPQRKGERGSSSFPWNRRYRPTGAPKPNLKGYPYSSGIHIWRSTTTAKRFQKKGHATFLNPSRTPFRFSYLLKRSERDLSTELRSARACSFSMVSCWRLFWEVIFVLCSSSVNHNQKQRHIQSTNS